MNFVELCAFKVVFPAPEGFVLPTHTVGWVREPDYMYPNKTLWWYLTYYQKLEVRNPLSTQVQTKPGEGEGNRTTEINLGYRCGLTLRIVGIDSIVVKIMAQPCVFKRILHNATLTNLRLNSVKLEVRNPLNT